MSRFIVAWQVVYCMHCGAPNPQGTAYCVGCGKLLAGGY